MSGQIRKKRREGQRGGGREWKMSEPASGAQRGQDWDIDPARLVLAGEGDEKEKKRKEKKRKEKKRKEKKANCGFGTALGHIAV